MQDLEQARLLEDRLQEQELESLRAKQDWHEEKEALMRTQRQNEKVWEEEKTALLRVQMEHTSKWEEEKAVWLQTERKHEEQELLFLREKSEWQKEREKLAEEQLRANHRVGMASERADLMRQSISLAQENKKLADELLATKQAKDSLQAEFYKLASKIPMVPAAASQTETSNTSHPMPARRDDVIVEDQTRTVNSQMGPSGARLRLSRDGDRLEPTGVQSKPKGMQPGSILDAVDANGLSNCSTDTITEVFKEALQEIISDPRLPGAPDSVRNASTSEDFSLRLSQGFAQSSTRNKSNFIHLLKALSSRSSASNLANNGELHVRRPQSSLSSSTSSASSSLSMRSLASSSSEAPPRLILTNQYNVPAGLSFGAGGAATLDEPIRHDHLAASHPEPSTTMSDKHAFDIMLAQFGLSAADTTEAVSEPSNVRSTAAERERVNTPSQRRFPMFPYGPIYGSSKAQEDSLQRWINHSVNDLIDGIIQAKEERQLADLSFGEGDVSSALGNSASSGPLINSMSANYFGDDRRKLSLQKLSTSF